MSMTLLPQRQLRTFCVTARCPNLVQRQTNQCMNSDEVCLVPAKFTLLLSPLHLLFRGSIVRISFSEILFTLMLLEMIYPFPANVVLSKFDLCHLPILQYSCFHNIFLVFFFVITCIPICDKEVFLFQQVTNLGWC